MCNQNQDEVMRYSDIDYMETIHRQCDLIFLNLI